MKEFFQLYPHLLQLKVDYSLTQMKELSEHNQLRRLYIKGISMQSLNYLSSLQNLEHLHIKSHFHVNNRYVGVGFDFIKDLYKLTSLNIQGDYLHSMVKSFSILINLNLSRISLQSHRSQDSPNSS